MITKFNTYNESLINKMKGKSIEDIKTNLNDLSDKEFNDKIFYLMDEGENMIKLLLNTNREIYPNYKKTLMFHSALEGYLDILKIMIEKYKMDINIKNSKGDSLLDVASLAGQTDVIKYLLKKGITTDD